MLPHAFLLVKAWIRGLVDASAAEPGTRGGVDFFKVYPGMYVPHPLGIRLISVERSGRQLASEMLSLTKMNWNQAQFDGREPVTLRTSYRVGKILKYVGQDDSVAPRYAYYM